MTIKAALEQCKTLEEFQGFFSNLNWKYPALGGRRAYMSDKSGTLCLNDFIKKLNAAKFQPHFAYINPDELQFADNLITEISSKDEETLYEPVPTNAALLRRIVVAVKRVLTYIVRFFGNFRFNRDAILSDMAGQIDTFQRVRQIQLSKKQLADNMTMDAIVLELDIRYDALPALDQKSTMTQIKEGFERVALVEQNKRLTEVLLAKVRLFDISAMTEAFSNLQGTPDRFEWFARFVACVAPKERLPDFINGASPELKKQLQPHLFNQNAVRDMVDSAPLWLKPFLPKILADEKKRHHA